MTITWACGQNWKTCHDSASSSSSDPEAGGQSEDHTQPGSLRQHSLWPGSPQRRWAHRPAWQLRRPQHRRPMWAVLPTTPFSPFCGFCKPQDGEGTEIQLMRNQREPFTAACALRGRTSPSLWRQELGRGTLLMIVRGSWFPHVPLSRWYQLNHSTSRAPAIVSSWKLLQGCACSSVNN